MTILLAVPSEQPGGLTADLSPHFGHSPMFSLFRIDGKRVTVAETLPFGAREHGNCLVPVGLLAERGVTAIVAETMGIRPLNGFVAAGIRVFHAGDCQTVNEVLDEFIAGRLAEYAADQACAHHHDDDDHHHHEH